MSERTFILFKINLYVPPSEVNESATKLVPPEVLKLTSVLRLRLDLNVTAPQLCSSI